eukprot:8600576-Alexandrium_andersonii.AAC.1
MLAFVAFVVSHAGVVSARLRLNMSKNLDSSFTQDSSWMGLRFSQAHTPTGSCPGLRISRSPGPRALDSQTRH